MQTNGFHICIFLSVLNIRFSIWFTKLGTCFKTWERLKLTSTNGINLIVKRTFRKKISKKEENQWWKEVSISRFNSTLSDLVLLFSATVRSNLGPLKLENTWRQKAVNLIRTKCSEVVLYYNNSVQTTTVQEIRSVILEDKALNLK